MLSLSVIPLEIFMYCWLFPIVFEQASFDNWNNSQSDSLVFSASDTCQLSSLNGMGGTRNVDCSA